MYILSSNGKRYITQKNNKTPLEKEFAKKFNKYPTPRELAQWLPYIQKIKKEKRYAEITIKDFKKIFKTKKCKSTTS